MSRQSLLFVLLCGLVASASSAEEARIETGHFRETEVFAPAESAPARQVSRAMVRTVAVSGGRTTIDLPATGGRLLLWTLSSPAGRASSAGPEPATLHTPSGRALRGNNENGPTVRRFPVHPVDVGIDVAGMHEAIEVAAAEPGAHRIEVETADGAVTVVAAEPDSPLTLTTWASPLSRLPGQAVTLFAELRDGAAAVRGGQVMARLAAPGGRGGRALRLRDDGHQGDAVANDGIYTLRLANVPSSETGFWTARFDAEGRDGRGRGFARSSTSGFMVERAVARLVGSAVRAARSESAVTVEAGVQVDTPGVYRLDAILAGPAVNGVRPALAWGELTQRLETGANRLRLAVPVRDGGPEAELVELRLLGLEAMTVAGRTLVPVE